MITVQAEQSNTMNLLHDKNVQICDTGASMHATRSSKCTQNMHEEST